MNNILNVLFSLNEVINIVILMKKIFKLINN